MKIFGDAFYIPQVATLPPVGSLGRVLVRTIDAAPYFDTGTAWKHFFTGATIGITDGFDDNSLHSMWTAGYQIAAPNGTVTVAETGGQILITVPSNAVGYNGIYSTTAFDFSNKTANIQFSGRGISNNGSFIQRFQIVVDASNYVEFQLAGTSINTRSRIAGVNSDTFISYDATAHKYCRIRYETSASKLHFETSPDKATWTSQRIINPFTLAMTSVRAQIAAGTTGAINSALLTANFDDFSIE